MAGARVHYPQSWALVHFLHNTKDARFRELFRAYFRALRAGRSEAEAYEECFAPCAAELEKAYRAHIRSVGE